MSSTGEVLRDLAIIEKIIVAVEAARGAAAGTEIGRLKGVRIAGEKVTIVVIAE